MGGNIIIFSPSHTAFRIGLFFVLWASLGTSPICSAPPPADPCVALRDLRKAKEVLENNRYPTDRGLDKYAKYFGPAFLKDLAKLTGTDRWMDMGAGQAVAMREYILGARYPKAKTTAVVYRRPESDGLTQFLNSEFGNQLQYLAGRFIEQIPDTELPKAKLITDLAGPLMYTQDISGVLRKYASALEPGGKVYIALRGRENMDLTDPVTNEQLDLASFIRKYTHGLKVVDSSSPNYIVLERTAEKTDIPHLELVRFESKNEGKPLRSFQVSFPQAWLDGLSGPVDETNLLPALKRVLARQYSQGERRAPQLDSNPSKSTVPEPFSVRWKQRLGSARPRIAISGSARLVTKGGGTPVYEISGDGGKIERYFRPVREKTDQDIKVARRTLAASLLNRILGLKSVPTAKIGSFKGSLGVLSEVAPGIFLDRFTGVVDHRSKADAEAFEFLIGNRDVHHHNVKVTPNGQVQVFDHGLAWEPGLPSLPTKDAYKWWARSLPQVYSEELLARLQALDERTIANQLGSLLTPAEIEGFLLRRRILLEDASTRGYRGEPRRQEQGA